MEDDVVLADEVEQTSVVRLPPLFPLGTLVLRPLLGRTDVTDRRIEPYIKHLAIGTGQWHRHSPVQVACHRARTQTVLQPAIALAQDGWFPLLRVVMLNTIEHSGIDPFFHPLLTAIHGQVPMRSRLQHGLGPAQGAARVDQVLRAQGAATFLALVAVGIGIAAGWASAHDVAVGQELLRFFIVVLLLLLLGEGTVLVQFQEEGLRGFLVELAAGAVVDVEVDAEVLERLSHERVVLVHDGTRGGPLLHGPDGDGRPVLITSADEKDLFAACP